MKTNKFIKLLQNEKLKRMGKLVTKATDDNDLSLQEPKEKHPEPKEEQSEIKEKSPEIKERSKKGFLKGVFK